MTAYIGEFLGLITWTPLHFIILFFIWTIIYQSPQSEANFGYELSEILGYSLIVTLIAEVLVLYRVAWRIESDNLNGTLTIYLCRPVDYLAFTFVETIPISIVSFVLSLPVVIFLIGLMSLPIQLDILTLVGFILSLMISYILNFLCFVLVGMSTFYIRNIWAIRVSYMTIMQIIGGELLPVDLLPPIVNEIAYLLPFHLISFIPAGWILGRITPQELIFSFFQGIVWIVLLILITKFLWNKSIEKFEAAGG
jgi:ABC-2 type transport system permease protein